jgi:uncharacterized membrane protein YeaQ/YmgE (transglycosylase-associated protein family)
MIHILVVCIIGFVIGLIARALHPGDDKMGLVMTTLLGIGGSWVGTFLGQALGIYRHGQQAGWIGAIIGAIVLLVIAHTIRRMSR